MLRNFFNSIIITVSLILSSCSNKESELGIGEIARIGKEVLTEADVIKATPSGLSAVDSTAFSDAYINNWIANQLIYHEALRQIDNIDKINQLTEAYRRDLILWEYRRMSVNIDSALQITDTDIRAYYEAHPSQMKLDAPMVRGIYIKMEADDPAVATVRRLYASPKQTDIDRLEKVGLNSAIHYDYFRSQWIPAEQILNKIPANIEVSNLHKDWVFELTRDGFTYFLSVSDILPVGATMPVEAAEARIRETLEASRRANLDARLLGKLRAEALESGTLKLR